MTAGAMFHVTPRRNLPSIMAAGLSPRVGRRSRAAGEAGPAVFLFPDRESLDGASWLGEAFAGSTRLAVLEVTPDPSWRTRVDVGYEVAVLDRVPASALTLLEGDF